MAEYVSVAFYPQADGITALYRDGKLHTSGDYYHDKIDDWLTGFEAGMREVNPETPPIKSLVAQGKSAEKIAQGLKAVPKTLKVAQKYCAEPEVE